MTRKLYFCGISLEGKLTIPRGETLREPAAGKPIVYPPEVIKACGGPPLSRADVDRLAAEAPED